ncbi:MAG: energy transducer TonB, partial [Phaeodactylibacter sp.]|nr:energy transducer TonB [Phaeodactylibacter sp.]
NKQKKEKKEKHFIQKPQYPGGVKAIRAFIREQLQYPKEALTARIEGTVVLHYSVDYRGVVTDVRVVSGLGYGCDQEAVRLVQLLKFEVPKMRKLRVKFQKTIQIHFRLPKAPEIQYSYHTATKPNPEESGSSSYFYTIEWE